MDKNKIKKYGKDISIILLGNIFMGIAYSKWMVPNEIINGGVTSISMILNKVLSVPLLYLSNGLTLLLLITCYIFLGKDNFSKSIFGSLFYITLFSLFYSLPFSLHVNIVVDLILACIFIGMGYYCCIIVNASTVGVDVIALIMHKKNNNINIAKTISKINMVVLFVGLIVYGVKSIIIGMIFTSIYSRILDYFLKVNPLKVSKSI